MSYAGRDTAIKDRPSIDSRLKGHISTPETTDEGCPVLEEFGAVCGETNSLNVFKEFRQVYDDCIKKLEGSDQQNSILKKLAPLRKFIEDLWEQNTMLVETVEELEQEATCRVTNLQEKLNRSCQKELHCKLKAKEREVECLTVLLSEKESDIKKYVCELEELRKDAKEKNKKYKELLRRVKDRGKEKCEEEVDEDEELDAGCSNYKRIKKMRRTNKEFEKSLNEFIKNIEDQKNSIYQQFQSAESQLKSMASEKKVFIKERNEIANQLLSLNTENEKLVKDLADHKIQKLEKEELVKHIEHLKAERSELIDKVTHLQENIKDLNNNFKETRWALTSEVAEKHDQVQELKRCVSVLEEQLRQADMQTHFKEDIIKELRKELKISKKSVSSQESKTTIPFREHSPPTQLITSKSCSERTLKDDELKVDIHIFPLSEIDGIKKLNKKCEESGNCSSVEVQTEPVYSPSSSKMRNVSTQHKTRVQKLPRSFGTLTVTPWSGTNGELSNEGSGLQCTKETKKNLRGIYTVPFSQISK